MFFFDAQHVRYKLYNIEIFLLKDLYLSCVRSCFNSFHAITLGDYRFTLEGYLCERENRKCYVIPEMMLSMKIVIIEYP